MAINDVLKYRQQQRKATAAEWTSANPVLLLGEFGVESDTLRAKIGDGSTAWTSLAYIVGVPDSTPTPLGDFDISTTNQTYALSGTSADDIGTYYKVSWSGGDGTATFNFTGTGYTINGIDPTSSTNWQGDGQGFLKFRKDSATAFTIVDTPDIWDSDGGNFSAGKFEKKLNGFLHQYFSYDFGTFSTQLFSSFSYTFPLAITQTLFFEATSGSTKISGVAFLINGAIQPQSVTQGTIFAYNVEGVNVSGATDDPIPFSITDYWTTDNPRRT